MSEESVPPNPPGADGTMTDHAIRPAPFYAVVVSATARFNRAIWPR